MFHVFDQLTGDETAFLSQDSLGDTHLFSSETFPPDFIITPWKSTSILPTKVDRLPLSNVVGRLMS